MMLERHLDAALRAALGDSRVVLLSGARQVGKTTLAMQIAAESTPPREFLSLDDAAVHAAAKADPSGFVGALRGPVVIDEVQRVPELLPAIKLAVDRERRPGRFLLTGSANVLFVPRVSESLAGRMQVLTLWSMSQGEIEGSREAFVDRLFDPELPRVSPPAEDAMDLADRLVRGGYPEVLSRRNDERRAAWYGSYLTTVLQRDVREMAAIDGLATLPRLLALLASHPLALLNYADLSRGVGLPQTTLKRYLAFLEATYLVSLVPGWYRNVGKRLVKSPKVLMTDTGLACHLVGADARRLRGRREVLGPLLESFVAMELRRQCGWSHDPPELLHFRTATGREVDLVLERRSGAVIGVEVKAAATVGHEDFRGLDALAQAAGSDFHRGVLLYTGDRVVPFGPRLHAVPVHALWGWVA
jgi:predicted AAA+ superfamily ATPase